MTPDENLYEPQTPEEILTFLLYTLMRDHVPLGVIGKMVASVERDRQARAARTYTNAGLEQAAREFTVRLLG